jgi:hypothetical protein
MGLLAVLVDEARRVYEEEPEGEPWAEGEPPSEEKTGPWFRARLFPGQPRVSSPEARGRMLLIEGDAQLLLGVKDREGAKLYDDTGEFVAFDADDILEVKSKQLGTARWQVIAMPEPLRKKRRVIGYQCQLRRVRETVVAVAEEVVGP